MLASTKRMNLVYSLSMFLVLLVPAIGSAQDDTRYIPTENYFSILKRPVLNTPSECPKTEEEIKELTDGWKVLEIFPRPLMRPTFPVKNANRIFVAQVKGVELRFNCNRSAVYSQYDLSVEDILKEGATAMSTQTAAKVYNWGGGVRFDSGQVQPYRVHGVNFLKPDSRYVIFVSDNNGLPSIITAFELNNKNILQMSSLGASGVPDDSPLKNYQTMDEKTFMEGLKELIAAPPIGF